MKRLVVNIILSILFTITIISSLISITVLNDKYIIKIFNQYDLYGHISSEIKEEYKRLDKRIDFDTDQVRLDINEYIKNRYSAINIKDDNHVIYYNHIFFMKNNDIKKYSYIAYFITILLIIITGNLFLHTKKIHSIDIIFLLTSILIIMLSGYIYIFINLNSFILSKILYATNMVLLGVGVILLELVFLKYMNILLYKIIGTLKR